MTYVYCALVRPLLEYVSVIRYPFSTCSIEQLERVQKFYRLEKQKKSNEQKTVNTLNGILNSLYTHVEKIQTLPFFRN